MSVMVGVSIPSAGERVMEKKRLDMLSFIEQGKTQSKTLAKKKQARGSGLLKVPTLVPNVKNNTFSERTQGDKATVSILDRFRN